ncbi:hypothetical protein ACFFP0_04500 [Rhizobium puerariae]|uniref:Uncharacterized protein n=1 Tax=Rhizobium puerariae TaxID=1585791 RepID=A0ABV6ABU3_9HYPH
MSIASGKLPYLLLVAMAAGSPGLQPAQAADLADGYHSRPAAKAYRQRAVRTTYAGRGALECSDLRVTEWGSSRTVQVCHSPLDLDPPHTPPGGGSGDYTSSSS